ncbi:hypothetical protein SBV1_340051 [Verrucomicrobia bacterium]|nr:hypothetical protein SBV1_340051 [Verrucomicrobiota bacterium]
MALLSLERRQRLENWLSATGELCVHLYLPHSAGSGTNYLVRTVNELEELIAKQTWDELDLAIFRRLQYPLRGAANEAMLEQALRQIADGECFELVWLEHYYPEEYWRFATGDTHHEMREAFREAAGEQVGFGRDPCDGYSDWIYRTPDEVMVLHYELRGDHYEAKGAQPAQPPSADAPKAPGKT